MMTFEIGDLIFEARAVVFGVAEKLGARGMSAALEDMIEPLRERLVQGDPNEVTVERLKNLMTIPDIERVIHVLQFGELHEQYLRPSQLAAVTPPGGESGSGNAR